MLGLSLPKKPKKMLPQNRFIIVTCLVLSISSCGISATEMVMHPRENKDKNINNEKQKNNLLENSKEKNPVVEFWGTLSANRNYRTKFDEKWDAVVENFAKKVEAKLKTGDLEYDPQVSIISIINTRSRVFKYYVEQQVKNVKETLKKNKEKTMEWIRKMKKSPNQLVIS